MENKKTNRSKALTMLLLLVTFVVTMGVMIGCNKEENTPDSESDTTEVVEVTEDVEETETTEAEDPVEVVDSETENTETEDTEDTVEVVDPEEVSEDLEETERIQPEVFYSTFSEFTDFVNSLELEELVSLYYNEESEKNIIIYNTDEFIMEDDFILFDINSDKEISEVTTNTEVIEVTQGFYVYSFQVDSSQEQDLTITFTYTDGTEEEFNMHLIPE